MAVRLGIKFSFQSAAENLQRRRWPNSLRQTVPDRCSSHWNKWEYMISGCKWSSS